MPLSHLIPTRSPTLTALDSVAAPILTMWPMPSWPPTCPGCVGAGSETQRLVMMPRSEWQTPE